MLHRPLATFVLLLFLLDQARVVTSLSFQTNPSVPLVVNEFSALAVAPFNVADTPSVAVLTATVYFGDSTPAQPCTAALSSPGAFVVTCPSYEYSGPYTMTLLFYVTDGTLTISTTTSTYVVYPPTVIIAPAVPYIVTASVEDLALTPFEVFDMYTVPTVTVDYGDGTATSTCTVVPSSDDIYIVTCPVTHTYQQTQTVNIEFELDDSFDTATYAITTFLLPSPATASTPVISPVYLAQTSVIPNFLVTDLYTTLATVSVLYGDGTSAQSCTIQPVPPTYTISCSTYIYSAVGVYDVTFIMGDAYNIATTTTTAAVVKPPPAAFTVPPAPVSPIVVSTTDHIAPFTVTDYITLTTVTVNYGGGSTATCAVTAAGGLTYTVTCPSHTFNTAGASTLTFYATDAINSATTTALVLVAAPPKPLVFVPVVPVNSTANVVTTFNPFNAFDYFPILTATVNYGDSSPTATCTVSALTASFSYRITCPPTHVFSTPGVTTLQFELIDQADVSSSFTATTTVVETPGPIFLDSPKSLTPLNLGRSVPITTPFHVVGRYASLSALTVNFGDTPTQYACLFSQQSTGVVTLWYGDCLQSFVYTTTGTRTMSIVATDTNNHHTTFTQTITVKNNVLAPASPTFPAVLTIPIASPPSSIQFTPQSSSIAVAVYYYNSDYTLYQAAMACSVVTAPSLKANCPTPKNGSTSKYYFAKFVFGALNGNNQEVIDMLLFFV